MSDSTTRVLKRNPITALIVASVVMMVGCNETQHKVETPPLSSGIDLTAMDTHYRAQDDFHNFVNGNWLKNTPIPAEYGSYGIFVMLHEKSEKNLRVMIEEAAATPNVQTGSIEQKIGDYYGGFMDEEAIEARGIEGISGQLAEIKAISNKQQLMDQIVRHLKTGLAAPFDGGVMQDFKDSELYAYYMGQAGLGLPNRDYYLEKDNERFQSIVKAYPQYIAQMFSLAGIENGQAKAAAILALETKLAQAQWSSTENRNMEKIYNPMTLEQLKENSPAINWEQVLEGLGVRGQAFVVITQPSYFSALSKLIEEEPIQTWKSYLTLRLISGSADYLPQKYADTRFEFYGRKVNGLEKQKERWKRGVSIVDGSLGEALGRIYVKRHFPPEAKTRMNKLVDNLLAEFDVGIDNLQWMNEKTKAEAKSKLSQFTVKIGYPDKWRDYSALTIDRNDLIGNVRRTNEFEFTYNINKLGKPIDREEWGMTPQTVNAYYSPLKNEIVFPAAILQPPFFNMAADDAVNYGAIGLVIGHEISHGFDDQGSKFDGTGRLRNWWTQEDRKQFEGSTSKLVNQYDAFSPLEGMNVKGELTLGENIGDLSGATVALNAYLRSLDGKQAPVIDSFTGVQRFFLGFAQAWRAKYREEVLAKRLVSDPHSPPRYRVNGVVPNMPEFYEAFSVKEGDGHYLPPEQRVKVW
jgi:putative endopeptidase